MQTLEHLEDFHLSNVVGLWANRALALLAVLAPLVAFAQLTQV